MAARLVLIAFHKPFNVLSQFTGGEGKATLADFIDVPRVYPAGRLDFDSEGLLLLTDDGPLQRRIADPAHRLTKRYLVQVEGVPATADLARFDDGLTIGEGAARYRTRPAAARRIAPPALAERVPPIRHRVAIPTSWIEVAITEGRNRQVRRMTAAVGYPTLRLLRAGIGDIDIFELELAPGMWVAINADRLASSSGRRKSARPV